MVGECPLDRLVDDVRYALVTSEFVGLDDDPGASGRAGRLVDQEPAVAAVMLSDLARRLLEADGDVGGSGGRCAQRLAAHVLDRVVADVQVTVLTQQPLEDGRRAPAVADELGDALGVRRRGGGLLRREALWGRRRQRFEGGELVERAVQETGFAEALTVALERVPADAGGARRLTGGELEPVQSYKLLNVMHVLAVPHGTLHGEDARSTRGWITLAAPRWRSLAAPPCARSVAHVDHFGRPGAGQFGCPGCGSLRAPGDKQLTRARHAPGRPPGRPCPGVPWAVIHREGPVSIR